MDPKPVDHLRVSTRNRDLARALLTPSRAGLQPSPWEWVAVITSYAAVHAVNAYRWETRRYTLRSRGERSTEVRYNLPISDCRGSYQALNRADYRARYGEPFALSEHGARTLLDVDSRCAEAAVMQALGQPAPDW